MKDLKALFQAIEYQLYCGEKYPTQTDDENHKEFSRFSDESKRDDRIYKLDLYDNRNSEDTIYDLYFLVKFLPTNKSKHFLITVCGDEYVVEEINSKEFRSFTDIETCSKTLVSEIEWMLTTEWLNLNNIKFETI
jgi:predicted subunit of tRNA(5-methylaminomethyl-2-thiouridylate) methyltransferase